MPHQANHLYDVWADGRHLIAKEYLSDVELDAPLNEYRALRLVESMDIAPQPLFFDPSVGPVVVYRYLEGTMWDRRVPAAAALAGLADLWVALHALPIADLWIGGGQARNSPTLVPRLRAPIERYAAWAAQSGDGAHREAARVCVQALERGLADGLPIIPEEAPLCFCRSDARFANVIDRSLFAKSQRRPGFWRAPARLPGALSGVLARRAAHRGIAPRGERRPARLAYQRPRAQSTFTALRRAWPRLASHRPDWSAE